MDRLIKPKLSAEIIEKIETHEKADIEFFHDIKNELKEILKKENVSNER